MNNQEFNFMMKEMNRIPYPELSNIEANYKFGRILYDAYSGKDSELTGIMTYIFQELNNAENDEIKSLLSSISRDEMKHFQILGEMLVKLGMTPYFMGTYGNKWCSDNVKSFYKNLEEMLDFNIKIEQEGIKAYQHLINISDSDNVKAVISRIIMDEQNHIQIFEMLKRKYC